MAEIQSSNVASVENPFHNPNVLLSMQPCSACGGDPSRRSFAPRGAARTNLRSELLVLADRTADLSLKSDLARLAESLTPRPIARRRRPLTELDVRQLLYIAKSRPEWKILHALLLFVGCGGISCTELFRLRRADVILDRGKPYVRIAARTTGRGHSPSRTVSLTPLLAEAAETLLAFGEEWGSCLPEHFVLIRQTSKYGRPCDPTRPGYIKLFSRRFEDVRLLANLPDATWRRVELSGRMGVVEC